MGVFNSTCFVTNLTIEANDPVVGFFLFRADDDILGDSTDLWRPCGGAVFGEYNYYGAVAPKGHDKYHEWLYEQWGIAFEKGVFIPPEYGSLKNIEDVLTNAPREDCCGIRDARETSSLGKRPTPLSVGLVHRWAFDLVAEQFPLTCPDSTLVGWIRQIDVAGECIEYAKQLLACSDAEAPPPKPDFLTLEEDTRHFFARMLSPQSAELGDWWDIGLTGKLMREDVDEARLPDLPSADMGLELSAVYRLMYQFHLGLFRTKTLFYHPSRVGHQHPSEPFHEKLALKTYEFCKQQVAEEAERQAEYEEL